MRERVESLAPKFNRKNRISNNLGTCQTLTAYKRTRPFGNEEAGKKEEMKHIFQRQLFIITLVVSLFTLSASAHTYRVLVVNVPFKFSVGKRTLPPGEYRFVATGTSLFTLLDSQARIVAIFMTRPASTPVSAEPSKLIFEKGKRHPQLTRIAMDGDVQEVLAEEPTGHPLQPMRSFVQNLFMPPADITTPRPSR